MPYKREAPNTDGPTEGHGIRAGGSAADDEPEVTVAPDDDGDTEGHGIRAGRYMRPGR